MSNKILRKVSSILLSLLMILNALVPVSFASADNLNMERSGYTNSEPLTSSNETKEISSDTSVSLENDNVDSKPTDKKKENPTTEKDNSKREDATLNKKDVTKATVDNSTTNAINTNDEKKSSEETPADKEGADSEIKPNLLDASNNTQSSLEGLKFSISNNQFSKKTEYYSYEVLSWDINIDGTGIKDKSYLENGYIDIAVPSEYFESINVLKSESVKSHEIINNNDNTIILRVYLDTEINSVTHISFPINMTVKKRVTPNGYKILPHVTLHNEEQVKVSTANPEDKSELKIIYDDPIAYKTLGEGHYFGNKKYEYGGELDPNNAKYLTDDTSKLDEVIFTYLTNTVKDRDPASYNPGINKIRQIESIKIVDTLPIYTDKNGKKRTAYFDLNSNPGWKLSEDGKSVSYLVRERDNENGADVNLRDSVRLKLKFPGAPTSDYDNGNLIKNNVSLIPTYKNQTSDEQSPNLTDDIDFYLSGDLFYGAGIFKKTSNTKRTFVYDNDAPYHSCDSYNIAVSNNLNHPIKNIVITEGNFDKRVYASKITQSNIPPSQIKEINGILENGNKEKIAFDPNSNNLSIDLDKPTTEKIEEYVKKVESGDMDKSKVPNVPAKYKKIEIVMKDDFILEPGRKLNLLVEMKLTDPYNIIITGEEVKDQTYNNASIRGDVALNNNLEHFDFDSSDIGLLKKKKEKILFTKDTRYNNTGSLGEEILFTLKINTDGLSKARSLKDLVAFDLLPVGVTYTGYATENIVGDTPIKNVETIDNYKDTGRTAVLIHFKDMQVSEFKNPWINIKAKINENATTTAVQGHEEKNKNTAFLYEKNNKDFVNLASDNNKGADTWDVDDDSTTNELISANSTFMAKLAAELKSYKYIKRTKANEKNKDNEIYDPGAHDTAWLKTGIDTNFGEYFEYQLKTFNNTNKNIGRLYVFDRLEFYEGTNKRNELAGPIQVEGEGKDRFKIYYTTDSVDGNNPNTEFSKLKWIDNPSDFSKVTAFYIELVEGKFLNPYESVAFDVPVRAPALDKSLAKKKVINKSYVSYSTKDKFGESNSVYNKLPDLISISKKWQDADGKNIESPEESVKVELYKNNKPTGRIVELSQSNNWTNFLTFVEDQEDLKSNYSVKEVGDKDNKIEIGDNKYKVTYEGNTKDGFKVINKEEPETPDKPWTPLTPSKTDIKVEKIWQGKDGKEISAPVDKVEVELYRDGEKTDKKLELNKSNKWSGEFKDLDTLEKVDSEKSYEYTVKEVGEENGKIAIGNNKYQVSYAGTEEKGFSITNKEEPGTPDKPKDPDKPLTPLTPSKTDIKVEKNWQDKEGKEITAPVKEIEVELYRDGKATNKKLTLNAENKWSGEFKDLDVLEKVDSEKAYEYTVKEVGEETGKITIGDNKYQVSYEGNSKDGFKVTNKKEEPKTPDEPEEPDKPLTPLTPSKEDIKVEKIWQDKDGKVIDAPEEKIEVELYRDGKATNKKLTLNAENKWRGEFKDLDIVEKTDSEKAYEYTVKEVGEENGKIAIGTNKYQVSYEGNAKDGLKVINKEEPKTPDKPKDPDKPWTPLTPSKTDIKVEKIWQGKDGKVIDAPEDKIEVELYRDGKATGKKLELNKTNKWSGEFKDLDVLEKVDSEKAYEYTVKEVGEETGKITIGDNKYQVSYDGNSKDGFKVTNKQEPKSPDKQKTPNEPKKPNKPNNTNTDHKTNKPKEIKQVEKKKNDNKFGNSHSPKTGISGLENVLALAALSAVGLYLSKNNKEK
ncbi:Cna B-type domain-containing protein [Anaerococcus provencensis]|uniref:Cna B-type domain-containing protein n=1 Tax=Anaerococcus provencensis TaxID=938293 RepID=UPI0002F876BD|nr:Cna B-type domain-containing protein [Anaerococcus provencensis]